MKYIILGALLMLISIWGGAWAVAHCEKWMEFPSIITASLGFSLGLAGIAEGSDRL